MNMTAMLLKSRRIVALLFFLFITLLFLDFTGTLHQAFGWMAKIQFIPAILALNFVIVGILILVTLLFGRIYCSIICPFGIYQDIIFRIRSRISKKKKNLTSYSPPKSWLRYGVLGLFTLAIVFGVSAIISILDPYAAYGRIASNLFSPIYRTGNNLLALLAERFDSYTFYATDVWIKSGITLGIASITFVIVGILAWEGGRSYCNTICPVGTVLGLVSRFAIFRPIINTSACNKCGLCARNCKSSCIDSKSHQIDYSRCVVCMNCLEVCHSDAITFSSRRVKKNIKTEYQVDKKDSRRNFLSIISLFAISTTVKSQKLHVDGGLAEIEDKKVPNRHTPIVPPGALSVKNMKDHCTACQLCVSACPNNVLRPSSKLTTLMQPEMSFEIGYCRPECVECSSVCPTTAIKPITPAEKSAIAIGIAVWIKDNCIVNTENVQCKSCERHCPTTAITLVDRISGESNSLKIPVVDKELCIGCGACENLCPARPFSAIYVEGYVKHHEV